jgi:uridine phosphorylase
MTPQKVPILDFDSSQEAVISPRKVAKTTATCAVLSFFWEAVGEYANANKMTHLSSFRSEMPDIPLYVDESHRFLLSPMPVGAPMAGAVLEQIIALGVQKIVVCGGAGVLESIQLGKILIPIDTIRDEGTSYHYLEPEENARPDSDMVENTCRYLDSQSVPYTKVTTWTTDAFYRETKNKIELRRSQGATCVEMEASALFAIAKFRGVKLVQLLYSGDDVSGETWNKRSWNKQFDTRRNLLHLAIDICKQSIQ